MTYDKYHFVCFGVKEVREVISYNEPGDFPNLEKMSDDQLDAILDRCCRKAYNVWTDNGSIDIEELERLAFNEFLETKGENL